METAESNFDRLMNDTYNNADVEIFEIHTMHFEKDRRYVISHIS